MQLNNHTTAKVYLQCLLHVCVRHHSVQLYQVLERLTNGEGKKMLATVCDSKQELEAATPSGSLNVHECATLFAKSLQKEFLDLKSELLDVSDKIKHSANK